MGGIKTKGRGPDKKKRKSRKTTSQKVTPETPKCDLLRNIINTVSSKVKKGKKEENREPWAFDFGEHEKVDKPLPVLMGRHIFKNEEVEIDLRKL